MTTDQSRRFTDDYNRVTNESNATTKELRLRITNYELRP